MAPQQQQQLEAFVEGLMAIRPPKATTLQRRMAYQRWLLREVGFFYPNVSLVDAVLDVIAPMMGRHYPHTILS